MYYSYEGIVKFKMLVPTCGMIPALYRSDRGEISTFTETRVGLLFSGK